MTRAYPDTSTIALIALGAAWTAIQADVRAANPHATPYQIDQLTRERLDVWLALGRPGVGRLTP